MSFSTLGLLPQLLDAIKAQGYSEATPIQEKSIPIVLERKDLMAAAQTGTGKTAGFTLPILQILSDGKRPSSNHTRTLILTPTRELAAQILESVKTYGQNLPLSSTVVFGGVGIGPQMQQLRKGVDILVATPGRLLDLHSQNAVNFNELEILVLDEADRMLDMGFIHDIKRIIKLLPKKRQTLMFSATFSEDIRRLAKGLVHEPAEISVTPRNSTVEAIKHWICPVDKSSKTALLTHLINKGEWQQVLVFSRTKHGANRIATNLEKKNISATAIHGNKSQGARTRALADFKAGKVRVLVATDIAARGIDIDQLPHVINFDLPSVPEDYVHRIGRTGRAGRGGEAISLVSADEAKQLFDIERLIQKELERELIDDFVPNHDLPKSRELLPVRSKKPKKLNNQKPQGRNRNRNRSRNKNDSQGSTAKNSDSQKDEQKKPNKAKKRVFWSKKPSRKLKPLS
ncbi:DEAD/DEAH box helicase [Candidatus Thioglobus sp.]|nr:DEAD/DEAH box helicase [Candidatus Thioglobus sp.]